MRLTWTNSEWDNFSGVASKDNLMMLEENGNFLNANGDETLLSEKEIKRRVVSVATTKTFKKGTTKWTIVTEPTTEQIEGARKYYDSTLSYNSKTPLDKLKSLLDKANSELGSWQANENNGQNSINYNPYLLAFNDYSIIQKAAKAKANIRALNTYIIPSLEKAIANSVAIKEKADALKEKEDADAKAKAQALADAKAEADRIAQMKELNNQLINAKTPEEKASVQAQIDALAGNVAKGTGSSKMLVYGVVGLVVVAGLYMAFKNKN